MRQRYPRGMERIAKGLGSRIEEGWVERIYGTGAGVNWQDAYVTKLWIRNRRGELVNLHPNAAQRQYARNRGARNIILKSRQLGMTTFITARFFLSAVLRPGRVTLQVAHSQESAQQIFRIVRRFFVHLGPKTHKWLAPRIVNVRELAFDRTDSRYLVDTAGNRNVGRGLTVHHLHASEVALWPGDPQETMATLLAAVPLDGEIDIESTPNGMGGYFYSEWQRARNGEGFQPHFCPWWIEPTYRFPVMASEPLEPFREKEIELIATHGLRKEQILFRRHLYATYGSRAAQEFAENDVECFLRSGRPVFEVALIEARLQHVGEAQESEQNGALQVWLEPEPGRHYILGADVAEGISGGDYSAAEVIDAETGLQCAEMQAKWPMQPFAEEVARLGKRYNRALLAIERNNHGHTVLNVLQQQIEYPEIYRHKDAVDGVLRAGWPMNAKTKPEAITALAKMIQVAPSVFVSRRLLEECRVFEYGKDGEMAARKGTHDDLVIAMAIAQAVRAQGGMMRIASMPR